MSHSCLSPQSVTWVLATRRYFSSSRIDTIMILLWSHLLAKSGISPDMNTISSRWSNHDRLLKLNASASCLEYKNIMTGVSLFFEMLLGVLLASLPCVSVSRCGRWIDLDNDLCRLSQLLPNCFPFVRLIFFDGVTECYRLLDRLGGK